MALDLNLTPEATPTPEVAVTRRRRSWRVRLPRSPKMIIGMGILFFFVLIAIIGPTIAPYDPSAVQFTPLMGPSGAHWLGTTQTGQDVYSQVLVGTRSTVVVSLVAGAIATALSVIIGVTAGYIGGWLDEVLSMLTNIFLVLPALPLLVVITGYLPRNGGSNTFEIAFIISITGWAWGARVLRAQTLSLRKRDYVESARVVGERGWRIVGAEILPNLLPIVASSFISTVLYALGTVVALAYLGLVDVTHWSWGVTLFWASQQQAPQIGAWWWFLPVGLCIAIFGVGLAFLNFGIDEFINPRLRAAGLSRRGFRSQGQRLPRRGALGLTPVLKAEPALADTPTPVTQVGGDR